MESLRPNIQEVAASLSAYLRDLQSWGLDSIPLRSNAELLRTLREEMGECSRCSLHRDRKHLVFGQGNPDARLMFVGEAPGRDEDLQGEPFVGRAGKLLTKIIQSISLQREDVYIANVIKCRPPKNRNPLPEEIRTCHPFLWKQIGIIKPRIICTLGTFASQTLLETTDKISALRGRFFQIGNTKLLPTFHPAFLLRNQERKRDVWEDMKLIRKEYNEP